VDDSEIRELIQFIYTSNLSETSADGTARAFADQIRNSDRSPAARLVHGYLFFRIPLLRPERLLRITMPYIEPLYSRAVLGLILTLTAVGLYLTSRQWEAFTTTFMALFSLEGVALYGLALIVVKTLHELGHAYTATRHGVRVNTMGVAFMLMMPLLYTDVSDAWRLTSRRKKLAIDAAGISVELAVAGIATFLWAFLPDGPARSATFVLATTSWMMSLLINVNPFMRFDGYYLLSDAWGIPNLQSRAFAIARWQLREWLFAIADPTPEQFPHATRLWLIAYACATAVYRLFLFIGIALIVYHLFFKIVGIVLFVIEILWFIVLPVWREMGEWWGLRDRIMQTRRSLVSLSVLTALVLLACIPWSGTVVVPVTTTATAEYRIFPSRAARLKSLHVVDGQVIGKGDIIAVLHSDDLVHETIQTTRRIQLLKARLDRIAGDSAELSQRVVLASQLQAERRKLAGLTAETHRLTIIAPSSGSIRDLNPELHVARSISATEQLALIVSEPGTKAHGYIREEELQRIKVGASGRFIPDDIVQPAQHAAVLEFSGSGTDSVNIQYLASVYDGPIATEKTPDGKIRPRAGMHLLRFDLETVSHQRIARGVIHLEGQPESFAASAWRQVLRVLVRESGI
jgi:putative peptide zinc metalloprotease protein